MSFKTTSASLHMCRLSQLAPSDGFGHFDLFSDASSSSCEGTRASSYESTAIPHSVDEDDLSPCHVSKSSKRRRRRQKQRSAIRAILVASLRGEDSQSAVYGYSSDELTDVNLRDLDSHVVFVSAEHAHESSVGYKCAEDEKGLRCPRVSNSCASCFSTKSSSIAITQTSDATRLVQLGAQQCLWSPPSSPSAPHAERFITGTSPHAVQLADASARLPLARVRLGHQTQSIVSMTPDPVPVAVPFPKLYSGCISTHNAHGVSTNSILSSLTSPNAGALREWLDAGGLPTSPCSRDAAVELRAWIPDVYED